MARLCFAASLRMCEPPERGRRFEFRPKDDRGPCGGTSDHGGGHRMEYHWRRLGTGAEATLGAGQRAGMLALPQPHAPALRPGADCLSFESGEQLLLWLHPDRQPPVVQDADLLCSTTLCDARGRSTAQNRIAIPPRYRARPEC